MVDWERGGIPWRQGQFLTKDAAVNLKLVVPANKEIEIPIVVSHDCDISNRPEIEPYIEVILTTLVDASDGNCTHSKNPRKLHLSAKQGDIDVYLELLATGKRLIPKKKLVEFEPNNEFVLPDKELLTLQRWLAARYHRSAFPDAFDHRLNCTGLYKAIVKILKPLGYHIIAAFFDIGNGENVKRNADDVYTLAIYLVYSTENDPLKAERETQKAAQSISKAFEKHCFDADSNSWRNIELVECLPIADEAITYAQSRILKKWNIDYLSFRTDPVQPLP
jgi:hypothetical protein